MIPMMDFSVTERFTPLKAMIPPKLMDRSLISKRDIRKRVQGFRGSRIREFSE
jgi:hypothetical protein